MANTSSPLSLEDRKRRLRYRSWHRGCKETDVILGQFCDAHLEQFTEADVVAFEALLELDDWDIYAWVTGSVAVPSNLNNPIVDLLISKYKSTIVP